MYGQHPFSSAPWSSRDTEEIQGAPHGQCTGVMILMPVLVGFTAQLLAAQQAYSWDQGDLPVSAAATIVDEQAWTPAIVQGPADAPQPILGDEQLARILVDEQHVVVTLPWPTPANAQPIASDEQLARILVDEDVAFAPASWPTSANVQPLSATDEYPTAAAATIVDEHGWIPATPRGMRLVLVPLSGGRAPEPPATPFGLDEDPYRPPVLEPEEPDVLLWLMEEAPPPIGVEDEGYVPRIPALVRVPLPLPWATDEYPTPPAPFGLDHDPWTPARPWPIAQPEQPASQQDEYPTPRGFEFDPWMPAAPWVVRLPTLPFVQQDEIPTAPVVTIVDEDAYLPPATQPMAWQRLEPWRFDQPRLLGIAAVDVGPARRRGKYKPEHGSALVDTTEATGFGAEHASALRDLEDAGL